MVNLSGKTIKIGSTWALVAFLTGQETSAAAILDINSGAVDLSALFNEKLGQLSGCYITLHRGAWYIIFEDAASYALAVLACPDLEKQGTSFVKDFLMEER